MCSSLVAQNPLIFVVSRPATPWWFLAISAGWMNFQNPFVIRALGLISDVDFSLAWLLARYRHVLSVTMVCCVCMLKENINKKSTTEPTPPQARGGRPESVSTRDNSLTLPFGVAAINSIETTIYKEARSISPQLLASSWQ